MNKELIIRSGESTDFALLKDGKLIELHKDEDKNKFAVGDIFIAKIRKPVVGLNAAFVNVGYEKDAFLHYLDLGPQVKSLLNFVKRVSSGKLKDYSLKNFQPEEDIDKGGSIVDVLKSNQSVLVQIVKEPISTKGPRLSSEISIAGRYIVLVPFSNRVSVSQKITDYEEKDRLKRLVKSIKPKGFGVIIRTVAKDQSVAELEKDLEQLVLRWEKMCSKLYEAEHPSNVLGEVNRASSILRDVFNDTFTGIHVDSDELHQQVTDYITEIEPKKVSIVKLYNNGIPIFEKFGIERQIKTSFGQSVSMSKGAYLIIEHTEALHVIDVNSGNRSNKAKNQEDTALEVNLISAKEIARQLRLRDMGGIIVVDFIDMNKSENRRKLFDVLREEMLDDRAKHKILPPSKFGLVQITRQRVRPETAIKTKEKNPSMEAEVEAPITLVDKLEVDLKRLIKRSKGKEVSLSTHPFISAYLTKGFPSIRVKWSWYHKRWIKISPRDAYTYLEYHFHGQNGKKIR